MAQTGYDLETLLVDPNRRGQLPILDLHIPKRLKRTVQSGSYRVTVDQAFPDVIDLCSESTATRKETWINGMIREVFIELHREGKAHSIEVWQEGVLAGGLYGLAMGRIFCGESMFSRARDASKIALVHLCARLYAGGFQVLDAQFINDHLKQFGIYEISRDDYHQRLSLYADLDSDFIQQNRTERELLSAYFQARSSL